MMKPKQYFSTIRMAVIRASAAGVAVMALLCLGAAETRADFMLGDPVTGLSEPETTPNRSPFVFSATAEPGSVAPGSSGMIRIHVDISDGHKLYAPELKIISNPPDYMTFGGLIRKPGFKSPEPDGTMAEFYKKFADVDLPFTIRKSAGTGTVTVPLTVRYRGCSDIHCFLPEDTSLTVPLTIDAGAISAQNTGQVVTASRKTESVTTTESEGKAAANPFESAAKRFGLFGVLIAAFIWGFFASLTPCVYPMIPVTVSVIGAHRTGSLADAFRLSAVYVLGMSITYAVFGVIAAWTGGLFGTYANHPAVRILIAVIFVILALSMFDLIQMQLPSALSSRLNQYTGKGTIGVFITGAAAGAVVGPCVGPMLVGLLVYIAALGSKVQGFLIMWSFALGMGVLFMVIGVFSGAASALPKSGQWMETVRNVFGVLMLGLALYFIHPLISEPVFLLLLGALLIGTGIFGGALDPMPESPTRSHRMVKTIAWICLALGLVYTARFAVGEEQGNSVGGNLIISKNGGTRTAPIEWQADLGRSLAIAQSTGKPVLVDFFADWCAACNKLDRKTFTAPDVVREARNFVPVRIDFTDTNAPHVRELRKKYQIVGLPTILFLNNNGAPLPVTATTEFVSAGEMVRRMKAAHNSFRTISADADRTG